jgi:hypothetical protein
MRRVRRLWKHLRQAALLPQEDEQQRRGHNRNVRRSKIRRLGRVNKGRLSWSMSPVQVGRLMGSPCVSGRREDTKATATRLGHIVSTDELSTARAPRQVPAISSDASRPYMVAQVVMLAEEKRSWPRTQPGCLRDRGRTWRVQAEVIQMAEGKDLLGNDSKQLTSSKSHERRSLVVSLRA